MALTISSKKEKEVANNAFNIENTKPILRLKTSV